MLYWRIGGFGRGEGVFRIKRWSVVHALCRNDVSGFVVLV